MQFLEVFQTDTFELTEVSIDAILEAVSNISLSQEPVNPTRVGTIAKSIMKKGKLILPPVLVACAETQLDYCVSGRHRVSAAMKICEHYMITSSGALAEVVTEEQRNNILYNGGETLEPVMGVIYLQVGTLREVFDLAEAYNGSRSMSQAEKLIVDSMLNSTALKDLQLALKQKVQEAANVTSQTALTLVKHLLNRVPRTKTYLATSEGQQMLADFCAGYVTWLRKQPQTEVVNGKTVLTPYGNIARHCVKLLEEFLGTGTLEETLLSHQEPEAPKKQHTNVVQAQQAIADATAAALKEMQARMAELARENEALKAAQQQEQQVQQAPQVPAVDW